MWVIERLLGCLRQDQKLLDDQRVEHWLLRRRLAFRIEIVSYLSSGRPLSTERCDPIHYFVVMLQLFKTSYGSDNRMRRHDLSDPVAFYLGTLGFSEHPDDDSIEHHTGDGLPAA